MLYGIWGGRFRHERDERFAVASMFALLMSVRILWPVMLVLTARLARRAIIFVRAHPGERSIIHNPHLAVGRCQPQ